MWTETMLEWKREALPSKTLEIWYRLNSEVQSQGKMSSIIGYLDVSSFCTRDD